VFRVRCTAVALGYNISLAVIGGLTPLVASWLVARTGDEIAPGFLMMAAAALRFPETYHTPVAGITSRAAAAYA
jgi:MHS family proline/betaine transporter-like MFS transporter